MTYTKHRYAQVRPGLYRHYKGGLYEVVSVARHSETEETMVIYREFFGRQCWVRPATMFSEKVKVDGKWLSRFENIAEPVESLISGNPGSYDMTSAPSRKKVAAA